MVISCKVIAFFFSLSEFTLIEKKQRRRKGSLDITNYMGPWFMKHHTNVEDLEFLSTQLLELVSTIHGIWGMND